MTKKERALKAVEILKELYPDAVCSLEYKDPFQLLVAAFGAVHGCKGKSCNARSF